MSMACLVHRLSSKPTPPRRSVHHAVASASILTMQVID
jgi:hypothetical protein